MWSLPNVEIDVHLEDSGAPDTMAREVREGLTDTPRRIPSKYFYDERGSELFQEITRLPEYYLTRAESALLQLEAGTIVRATRMEELVELGSGAATKTRVLLEAGLAAGTLRRYIPVDVSQDIVEQSSYELAEAYPDLEVHAVIGDFEQHLGRVPHRGRRVVALLGSTIGNFRESEAVEFAAKIRSLLGPHDFLLLGTDLVKDRSVLETAYNDEQGVTAEFNRNILNVINHHLDGDFDPRAFDHVAYFNEEKERIESFLRSRGAQSAHLGALDLDVNLSPGEMLWTEVSCKYTRDSVERILGAAGLRLEHWFSDAEGVFALSLSRPVR